MGPALPLAIIAFLLGSIPSGYLIGKLYGVDIRKQGSGNTGATNANRVLGKKAGLFTLVFDVAKGIIAVWLGQIFPATLGSLNERDFEAVLGLLALIGHCYSPFLNFKGGKGVATGCGVFWMIAPFQTALAVAVFGMVLRATQFVSLSSITAAISIPLLLYIGPDDADKATAYFAAAASALIIFRHQENIKRLMAGTEPRFQQGRPISAGVPKEQQEAK